MSTTSGKQDEWTTVDKAVEFLTPGGAWDGGGNRENLTDPEWLAGAAREYLEEWVRPAIDHEVWSMNDSAPESVVGVTGLLVARYPSVEECLEHIQEAAGIILGRAAPRTVQLNLLGLDGNAFALLGAFRRQAAREGWSAGAIALVTRRAQEGDYDHLLRVLMEHCEAPDDEDEDWFGGDDETDDDE